jgi:RNA polymerase sigma-70 factor (ECF subfamily)
MEARSALRRAECRIEGMDLREQAADQEAVRRVLAGDVEAFDAIVRRWQGPLVSLAYRYCRDRGRSEEWAQEAFLRAFRNLESWREEAAFSTWLFAVAANVYRSESRKVRPPEVPLATDRPMAGPANLALELETEERDEIVRRAVCALPEKYRDVLVAFYFLEHDVAEVSSTLGLPQGTVKARLHRGRAQLQKRLQRILGVELMAEAS